MSAGALVEQLSMETGMYIELQSVLEEEQKAVIKRDYQGLYDVLSKKEEILSGLSAHASSRGALVASMLREAGKGEAQGLAALIELQEGTERAALRRAREGLARARERVRALNRRNRLLIASSLENLGRALDFLESFAMGGTYLSTGLRGAKSLKGTRLRKGV